MPENNYKLPATLLMIDDDRSLFELLEPKLRGYGVIVDFASNYDSALYLFNTKKFEVIIVELEFSAMPGTILIQKLRQIKKGNRHLSGFIVAHGQNVVADDIRAIDELGDICKVLKPLEPAKMIKALTDAGALSRKLHLMEDAQTTALDLYLKTSNIDESFAAIDKKIPDSRKDALVAKCFVLEETQQFEKAVEIANELIKSDPKSLSYVNQKARYLFKLGRKDEALKLFEEADKVNPQNLERLNSLASIYLEKAKPESSIEKMEELVKFNPEIESLKFDFFTDLNNAGFQDFAVKFCKKTTSPKEIVTHYNNKGVLDAQSGKVEEALKEYYMALMVYPTYKDNYKIQFNIALAEARKNTAEGLQKSLIAAQSCLRLKPDFQKAVDLIEKLKQSPLYKELQPVEENKAS